MRPATRGTDRPLREVLAGPRGGLALSAGWDRPPERPSLGADETHVWAFEAGSPAARDAGRRSILARYAGLPPDLVRFEHSAFGKPELATPGHCRGLRISFSASDGLVLVALRRDQDIGVDVEATRDLPAGIAQRAMTATERRAFESLPQSERAPRFLALWVAKEAVTKAAGRGLRQQFDAFDAAGIVHLPGDGGRDSYWTAALPTPRPGFAAAVASAAPIGELRLWSLLDAPGG